MAEQLWSTNAQGGFFGCPKLDAKLWEAVEPLMRFRQFCSIKTDFGKNNNDTIYFDKVSKLTTAGGTLVETSTIPRSNFILGRGTAVVTEWGNSVPYTGKLEALAEFNVDNAVHKALMNDQAETLDSAAGAQFKDTLAKYVILSTSTAGTGTLTTNGTAASTATGNLNAYYVKQICDQLRKWNVRPVDNHGNYVCIGSVNALSGIKDDSKWIDAYKYAKPEQLFTNEAGKYYGVRFVEETNVLSNILGGSYGEAVFFGDESVKEIVVIAPEIRRDPPKDAGRDKRVAWYAIMAFKNIWCGTNTGDSVNTARGWVPHIIHCTSL